MKKRGIQQIIVLVLLSFVFKNSANAQNRYLSDWVFREDGHGHWQKAFVPGCVHTDLLKNKQIHDPFFDTNEDSVQWISKKNWEYKTSFTISSKEKAKKNIDLFFNGIDTYAEVYLNGKNILTANNMFRTWSVNVKHLLKDKNVLRIVFKSAENYADSCEAAARPFYRPVANRLYVRKAQFQFGWDFAPRLITCGIWRPVELQAYDKPVPGTAPKVNDVKLIMNKDAVGTSFYFTVKGKPVYMKGANWVPADVFPSRVSKEKYRSLLIAAKEAGMNMLRVWGGGIYEDDYFYELCDSLSIYVWQDLMFANAIYPSSDKNFIENVKAEIRDNITRLRKFKCIVLWCGNNETGAGWFQWNWAKRFKISEEDSVKLYQEYLYLFDKMIPKEIAKYDSRQYISSSPVFYGWQNPSSFTDGDSHYWGVWAARHPIENYAEKVPRFASEFGMLSFPSVETVKKFTSSVSWNYKIPDNLVITDPGLVNHLKHNSGTKNIAHYLEQNKFKPRTLEEYVNASMEIQRKAMEIAVTAQMNSNGKCMGTLVWQFNDPWPVASWSLIDYYGNKKPVYYTLKKLYTTKE